MTELKVVEKVYSLSVQTIITLLFAVTWMLKKLEQWLTSMIAVLNGLTLDEFENAWHYKYLFE